MRDWNRFPSAFLCLKHLQAIELSSICGALHQFPQYGNSYLDKKLAFDAI